MNPVPICDAITCEACGNVTPFTVERVHMQVCMKCATAERWCPSTTLYVTQIQAWRSDFGEGPIIPSPRKSTYP